MNFLYGMLYWVIFIVLEYKGEIVVGVVYDLVKDEMFYVECGEGVWLNDSKCLCVLSCYCMIESVFVMGIFFVGCFELLIILQDFVWIMLVCVGVCCWGFVVLDLVYVVVGCYEGYWECGLNVWDLVVGMLIVKEVGGFVEVMDKGDFVLESGIVLVVNELIFD